MVKGQDGRYIMSPDDFLAATQNRVVYLGAKTITDGGTLSWEFPRIGLGHMVHIYYNLEIATTGTISSGTWNNTYPNPAHAMPIKRLRFGANNGVNVRDHSGLTLLTHNYYRYMIEPFVAGSGARFCTEAQTSLGLTGSNRIFGGGSIVTNTTYTLHGYQPMPLSFNETGEKGLLILQNDSIFTLQIDLPTIFPGAGGGSTDMVTSLVGSGIGMAITGSVAISYEFFEAPDPTMYNYDAQLALYMRITDRTFSNVVAGPNNFRPNNMDFMTLLLGTMISGGSPVADSSLTEYRFSHSTLTDVHRQDRYTAIGRDYLMHKGRPPMNGVICYDFGLRAGLPDRRDMFDSFSDQNITDVEINVLMPTSLSLSNPQFVLITESMNLFQPRAA